VVPFFAVASIEFPKRLVALRHGAMTAQGLRQ